MLKRFSFAFFFFFLFFLSFSDDAGGVKIDLEVVDPKALSEAIKHFNSRSSSESISTSPSLSALSAPAVLPNADSAKKEAEDKSQKQYSEIFRAIRRGDTQLEIVGAKKTTVDHFDVMVRLISAYTNSSTPVVLTKLKLSGLPYDASYSQGWLKFIKSIDANQNSRIAKDPDDVAAIFDIKLQGCPVGDAITAQFAAIKTLSRLVLDACTVKFERSSTVDRLFESSSLQILDLSNNNIKHMSLTDPLVSGGEYPGMMAPSLQTLILDGTQMKSSDAARLLMNLPLSLKRLSIKSNNLRALENAIKKETKDMKEFGIQNQVLESLDMTSCSMYQGDILTLIYLLREKFLALNSLVLNQNKFIKEKYIPENPKSKIGEESVIDPESTIELSRGENEGETKRNTGASVELDNLAQVASASTNRGGDSSPKTHTMPPPKDPDFNGLDGEKKQDPDIAFINGVIAINFYDRNGFSFSTSAGQMTNEPDRKRFSSLLDDTILPEEFNLSAHGLSDQQKEPLSVLLKNRSIRKLNLSNNALESTTIRDFIFDRLTHLILNSNPTLGDDGAKILFDKMRDAGNLPLEEIYLDGCNITNLSLCWAAVSKLSSLRILSLKGMADGDRGLLVFNDYPTSHVMSLMVNSKLHELRVDGMTSLPSSEDGCTALRDLLPKRDAVILGGRAGPCDIKLRHSAANQPLQDQQPIQENNRFKTSSGVVYALSDVPIVWKTDRDMDLDEHLVKSGVYFKYLDLTGFSSISADFANKFKTLVLNGDPANRRTFESIKINWSNVKKDALVPLKDVLQNMPLKEIHCGSYPDADDLLTNIVVPKQGLRFLDVSKIYFYKSESLMNQLKMVLESNQETLEVINLSECWIGSCSTTALRDQVLKAIPRRRLKKLDLSTNRIGKSAFKVLHESLQTKKGPNDSEIIEVSFKNNRLKELTAEIRDFIAIHPVMKIDLSSNYLGNQAQTKPKDYFSINNQLIEIISSDNNALFWSKIVNWD